MADTNPTTKILTEILDWNKKIHDEKIFGDVPIISDLLYGITALFTGFSSLVLAGLNVIVEIILKAALSLIDTILLIPLSAMSEQLIDYLIDQQLIDRQIKDLLTGIIKPDGIENHLLAIILYLMTSFSSIESIMQVSNVKTQQLLLEKIRPILPTPDQLIRLLFLRPEYKEKWVEMLGYYGYTNERIDNLMEASMSPLGEEQIRVGYWRKLLSHTETIEKLRMIGKTERDISIIMESWKPIPSPQDLFWMVGKEAFEADQIERFGLDDEYPIEQDEHLEKQGITEYWRKKYWIAHWNYPGVSQVLECLHRNEVTLDDVREFYRVVEIPKFWRDKLIKISYHPYTRVDVRRMHALGIISPEQLKRAYQDIGYDEEKAEGLRDFTIKYNKGSEDELSKTQILNFYQLGILTEQDAILMLEEIGIEPPIIALYLKKVKLSIQKEYIKEVVDVCEHLYINNRLNTGGVYSRLSAINIATEKIENYIDKWDISKQKIRKLPTKEDLIKFLQNEIITKKDFQDVMKEIGFDKIHIEWYLKLISRKD